MELNLNEYEEEGGESHVGTTKEVDMDTILLGEGGEIEHTKQQNDLDNEYIPEGEIDEERINIFREDFSKLAYQQLLNKYNLYVEVEYIILSRRITQREFTQYSYLFKTSMTPDQLDSLFIKYMQLLTERNQTVVNPTMQKARKNYFDTVISNVTDESLPANHPENQKAMMLQAHNKTLMSGITEAFKLAKQERDSNTIIIDRDKMANVVAPNLAVKNKDGSIRKLERGELLRSYKEETEKSKEDTREDIQEVKNNTPSPDEYKDTLSDYE
ncbi:MAG: hypothetical protein R3Y24_14955 [Eubacteriales bacterium]